MKQHAPPKIRKLAPPKQRRLDELLEKNSEGSITPAEKERLKRLVAEAEQLMVANAQRLAEFTESEATDVPPAAVPVTVWVCSQPVEP